MKDVFMITPWIICIWIEIMLIRWIWSDQEVCLIAHSYLSDILQSEWAWHNMSHIPHLSYTVFLVHGISFHSLHSFGLCFSSNFTLTPLHAFQWYCEVISNKEPKIMENFTQINEFRLKWWWKIFNEMIGMHSTSYQINTEHNVIEPESSIYIETSAIYLPYIDRPLNRAIKSRCALSKCL